jgi:hypothetical protein
LRFFFEFVLFEFGLFERVAGCDDRTGLVSGADSRAGAGSDFEATTRRAVRPPTSTNHHG